LANTERRILESRLPVWILALGWIVLLPHTGVAQPISGPAESREKQMAPVSDFQALVQATIDVPSLQPYFHVDRDHTRKPLIIVQNENVSEQLQLNKFGVPVLIVPRAQLQGRPYIELRALEVHNGAATVQFEYPVEGVRGSLQFARQGSAWQLTAERIVER
jgi:hypothetical protein